MKKLLPLLLLLFALPAFAQEFTTAERRKLQVLGVTGSLYCSDAGANDTYTCSLSPTALQAYVTGLTIVFKPNTTNTGAATVNINSLGAKNIVTAANATLADGDLTAGRYYQLVYDGTSFRMHQDLDAQTITLQGDVTGTGTGTFTTTIAANSVALGTDTTGDYVSSATANQGLLITGTEGASAGLIDCAANQILKRNAGDTAWECAADATGGSPSFDLVTGGTNTAALVMGTAGSLTTSGSGTIAATTAAALGANAANCSAGQAAGGVSAAGAAEDCTAYLQSVTAHNVLSATHGDSAAGTVVLGDIIHGNVSPAWARLAGNVTTTKKYLSQTGTGAASAVPSWDQIAFTEISGSVTDAQVPNTITVDLAATVTTNANLTGHVTSTGNAAVLGSFTVAQLNTAISDADVAKAGAVGSSDLTMNTARLLCRTTASAGAIEECTAGTGLTLASTSLTPVAASTTASGIVELAIASEVDTGTDATRAITPDALAGSTIFGRKVVQAVVFDFTTAVAVGDGKFYFTVPVELNGMNLVAVSGHVITVSSSGAVNVDLARCATAATGNTCSGTVADMLSTNLTIDANESKSSTAAAAAVIDTANDDVATEQVIRIDVDGAGTGAQGLIVTMSFQLP